MAAPSTTSDAAAAAQQLATAPTPPPHQHCANCDAELHGDFCSKCGQKNSEIAVSLKALAREFADEYLSLDSRLFRSVLHLFVRPGYLTRQYVIGRRERYVRPLRLYLVSSILFFFSLSFLVRPVVQLEGADTGSVGELFSSLSEAEAVQAEAGEPPAPAGATEAGEAAARAPAMPSSVGGPRLSFGPWGVSLEERVQRVSGMTPKALVETIVAGFERYLPRMMFLLLPVFALLLKMLYVRRHWYYAEHFIFTLHFHAFAFTLFLLLLALPAGQWKALLTLWGAVYLFWAMYRMYRQPLWKTATKYVLLTGTYSVLLALAVVSSVLLTLVLL